MLRIRQLIKTTEFSGTLLGFDDFVSECKSCLRGHRLLLTFYTDMVLEDVTE